jgi:hypothetical protein
MIQRVIFTKLAAGQLDESGLTLEDLRVMTSRMASTLVNMYHGRIKYPWQREAERGAAATPPPAKSANGSAEPGTGDSKTPIAAMPIAATPSPATTATPSPVADAPAVAEAAPEPTETPVPTARSSALPAEPKAEAKL